MKPNYALPLLCTAIDRFASALSVLVLPCHGGAVDCRAAPLLRSPLARCACARICSPMSCRCYAVTREALPLRCFTKHCLCVASRSTAFALLGLTVPCPCPVWPCHAYASLCLCVLLPDSATPLLISAHQRFAIAMRGPALPCHCCTVRN